MTRRRMVALVAASLMAATGAGVVPAGPATAQEPAPEGRGRAITVEELPGLGGAMTFPSGINNRGQATGASLSADGVPHAVLWEDGEVTDLTPDLPPRQLMSVVGVDIGESGRVAILHFTGVGPIDPADPADPADAADPGATQPYIHVLTSDDGVLTDVTPESTTWAYPRAVSGRDRILINDRTRAPYRASVWDGGDHVEVPSPDGIDSYVVAANDRGLVVGSHRSQAFAWRPGQDPVALGTLGGDGAHPAGVNDRGDVVGVSSTADGEARAFLWRHGRMTDLGTLGGASSEVVATPWVVNRPVNDRGDVVGSSMTASGETHAFLWRHGRMTDLGTLGGDYSGALSVNNRGQVIGMSTTADGVMHPFVWQDGRMFDLTSPLGGEPAVAVDINDRGQVVGFSVTPGSLGPEHAYMWTIPRSWPRH